MNVETLINNIKEAIYCIQFNLEIYEQNEKDHINYAINKTMEIINMIDEFELELHEKNKEIKEFGQLAEEFYKKMQEL